MTHNDIMLQWYQERLAGKNYVEISVNELHQLTPQFQSVEAGQLAESWKREITFQSWRYLRSKGIVKGHVSPEFLLLLSVGRGGGDQPEILHGGVFGELLDHIGSLAAVNAAGPTARVAEINLEYRKKLPLPNVVSCRAMATEIQGEHVWVAAFLEDRSGAPYCEAKIRYAAKKVQSL